MTSLLRSRTVTHEAEHDNDMAEWARVRALGGRRHPRPSSRLARILSAATTLGAIAGVVALTRGCYPSVELRATGDVVRAKVETERSSRDAPTTPSAAAGTRRT